jgi:cytidylate kinase
MSSQIVIAIDGPAGSGKSTLARALAVRLELPYLNTGSMYRALTREALIREVDPDDVDALVRLAADLRFDLDRSVRTPTLSVDGKLPGEDLSAPEVEANVSAVSRHPEVRAVMRAEQRRLGAGGAVLEGRDIGSVVLPDATLKVFLDADPEVRAERRARQRYHVDLPPQEVAEELEARDRRDALTNPLEPPDDAVVIDTSLLSIEETVRLVLDELERRTGRRLR